MELTRDMFSHRWGSGAEVCPELVNRSPTWHPMALHRHPFVPSDTPTGRSTFDDLDADRPGRNTHHLESGMATVMSDIRQERP